MDVEIVVSKALEEVENLDPEEFEELKKEISKYEEVKSLARKVAEEDKRITVALSDKLDSGDEESIELELSKICSPEKLKRIKESLETETFNMYIAKIDGIDTVTTMRNGKEVFPPIQIESVADVNYSRSLQWASILIELAILAGDCVGVHLHISTSRIKSVSKAVAKLMRSSAMQRAMRVFLHDWRTNTRALARARAIFELLRKSYSLRILVNTFKLICQDMTAAEWLRTAGVLAASLFAAFATGGVALIAKIAMAVNGAYNLVKKITNDSHLTYIENKMNA